MIIDNTKQDFEDVPATLNDEVLLDRPAAGGFITCSQENAYLYSIATVEQQLYAGHDAYDYSTLDKVVCRKPKLEDIAVMSIELAQSKLDSLPLPDAAKTALQNRIDNLLTAMQAVDFDDGLRMALQLPLDIF